MISQRFLLTLVGLLILGRAHAAEPSNPTSGFSGNLSLGALYGNERTNAVAAAAFGLVRLSEPAQEAPNQAPRAYDKFLPIVTFTLQYTFASTGTQIFGGSWQHGDPLQFDYFTQGGIRQGIGGAGKLSAAYLFALPVKVWGDPYLTGGARTETNRWSQGGRLAWEGIFGSALQAQYTFRHVTIEDEQSGLAFGLDPGDRARLQRAGNVHQGELSYTIKLARGALRLTPLAGYSREALQGGAMSADTFEFKLRTVFATRVMVAMLDGSLGHSAHDRPNAIFGKTQEDRRYSAATTLIYRMPFGYRPFGYERWNVFGTVRYNVAASNIAFFSAALFSAGGGVGIEF